MPNIFELTLRLSGILLACLSRSGIDSWGWGRRVLTLLWPVMLRGRGCHRCGCTFTLVDRVRRCWFRRGAPPSWILLMIYRFLPVMRIHIDQLCRRKIRRRQPLWDPNNSSITSIAHNHWPSHVKVLIYRQIVLMIDARVATCLMLWRILGGAMWSGSLEIRRVCNIIRSIRNGICHNTLNNFYKFNLSAADN